MTTEMRSRLKDLRDDCTSLYEWMLVYDFCQQAYGPDATNVTINTYGEYNDEGGTDYHISEILCYNELGDRLEFNFYLPFWQMEHFEEYCFHHKHPDYASANYEEKCEAALDALREFCVADREERLLFNQNNWVLWDELPCDRHTGCSREYDLMKMPIIRK